MTAFTFLLALLALPFMVGVSHAQPPDEGVFVEVPSTVPPAPGGSAALSIATTSLVVFEDRDCRWNRS